MQKQTVLLLTDVTPINSAAISISLIIIQDRPILPLITLDANQVKTTRKPRHTKYLVNGSDFAPVSTIPNISL